VNPPQDRRLWGEFEPSDGGRSARRVCCRAVELSKGRIVQRILPWLVSAAALFWVFGSTDWRSLLERTREADLFVFVAITMLDKAVFFLVWAFLQAEAIRRFVVPVSRLAVLQIRGGSELFRTVSNPLADAAFLLGVGRLTGGRLDAVVAAAVIPFLSHLLVLLAQATLALPLLPGAVTEHRGVLMVVGTGWAIIGVAIVVLRSQTLRRLPGFSRAAAWLDQVPLRALAPFVGAFAALAAFDVLIQGLASRAFGIPLPWLELIARIPILYLALTVPSVGNFGVREAVWTGLFEDFAPHDALTAFAFATNTIFLVLNVAIGVFFLRRAMSLLTVVRKTRKAGEEIPEPLLRDAIDP